MEKMSYDYYICNLSVTPFRRTKDPVIKEVFCNGNQQLFLCVGKSGGGYEGLLLQQYLVAELEKGDD